MPFLFQNIGKNAQIINPNCRWNPELIKIDLFLELDDGFGQVYTNLDKFKPIRGKNAQIIILNPKGTCKLDPVKVP